MKDLLLKLKVPLLTVAVAALLNSKCVASVIEATCVEESFCVVGYAVVLLSSPVPQICCPTNIVLVLPVVVTVLAPLVTEQLNVVSDADASKPISITYASVPPL